MPPLCTAGFSLATGNFSSFLGAIYLFSINCLFITLATYFLVRYFGFRKAEYTDEKVGLKIQRISTILILLFLVPSIWSAVILVKQTNFEKRASLFVETHRSIENSVIYDFKIDHQDGSVLKIFMTGETLSVSGKSNLLASAKEHGIKEEQLIIKEYTTQNTKDNEAVFKGIYERLDSEIESHEKTIEELKSELQRVKQSELPYLQLAGEISAAYPEVKHIYMAHGAHVSVDSLALTPCVMIELQSTSLMTESAISKFKKWVQVRLKVENVEVHNTIIK